MYQETIWMIGRKSIDRCILMIMIIIWWFIPKISWTKQIMRGELIEPPEVPALESPFDSPRASPTSVGELPPMEQVTEVELPDDKKAREMPGNSLLCTLVEVNLPNLT